MISKPIVALVGTTLAVVLLASAARGTSARWQDIEDLHSGDLHSGELSLLNGDASSQTADYAFTELTGAGLGPGSWSQAPLTIRNGGSAGLDYWLLSTSAPDATGLAAAFQLRLSVVTSAASCPIGMGAAAPTGPVQVLYDGVLLGASSAARPLAVGAAESLCVRVAVSNSAASSSQGAATAITFTFGAVST